MNLNLFTLSSDTYQGLLQLESEFIKYLNDNKSSKLGDICYYANKKHSGKACRISMIASSINEVIEGMELHIRGVINNNTYYHEVSDIDPTKIILFSCQGFEYANMGKDLYKNFPIFRDAIDECEKILMEEWSGVSLKEILWGSKSQEISKTLYNHPTLCSLEYATYKLWNDLGLIPDAVIGHSIGEYVALSAAGVLTFKNTLRLVAQRSKLFDSIASTGEMLSIQASSDSVLKSLIDIANPGTVYISAINGEDHTVISGLPGVVSEIDKLYSDLGVKTKHLKSEHAFHSPLMRTIINDFDKCLLRSGKISEANIPLLSTVTGDYIAADLNFYAHIKQHLIGKVNFYDAIKKTISGEDTIFIEVGPDDALCQMGQLCVVESDSSIIWQSSMLHGEKELEHFMSVMAMLYVQGINFNWDKIYDMSCINNVDINIRQQETKNAQHGSLHPISAIVAKVISEPDQTKQRALITEYLLKEIVYLSHGEFNQPTLEDKPIIELNIDSLIIVRLRDDLVKHFELKISIFDFFSGLKWSDITELCLESIKTNRELIGVPAYYKDILKHNINTHYEALFFDLDGTLWDSLEILVNSRNKSFSEMGLDFAITAKNIKDSMSYPSRQLLHRTFPDLQPDIIEKLNMIYMPIVDTAAKGNSSILYPGVAEVLQELKKNYKLFLVSTCRQSYMNEFLKLPEISGVFDDYESTGDTQRTKQSSIEDIMSRHNIKHSCYIGDTEGDYNSAILAGASFIFATYGYGKCTAPSLKIKSIREVPLLLDSIADPKALFNLKRFIGSWTLFKYFLFLTYIPIGVLLLLIRLPLLFAWQLIGHFVPLSSSASKIYFKAFQVITGGVVKVSGHSITEKLASSKIIVCNHISTLDSNYWMSICQSSVVVREGVATSPVYKLNMRAKNAFVANNREFFKILTKRLTDGALPIFLFPEGATTNGTLGLLRFSPLVFSLEQSILPVALSITTPFSIALTKIKQSFFIDLLWALFIPYKTYNFKILSAHSQKADESAIDFADRVQYLIANEIGVFPTLFTIQDKNKLRGEL